MFDLFNVLSIILITILTYILIKYVFQSKTKSNSDFVSLMVILGSGGHTTEMIALLNGLKIGKINGKYSPVTFVTAKSDLLSEQKLKQLSEGLSDCQLFTITRSRSVGQSYWTSIVTTFISMIESFYLLYKVRPELIVCNGPAICYPICLSAKVISKLFKTNVCIVFVESFCRTETLSLTGKLLYYSRICDHFLVQWPQLNHRYNRTKFIGLLV